MRRVSEDNQALEPIERLVGRVRRRVNLRVGLERATTGAVVALMLATVVLALWKTGWIGYAEFTTTAGVLTLLPLTAFGSAWLADRDPVSLAQRLDKSHRLHDRLSTALSIAREDRRDEFGEAQIRDALAHVDEVEPARAVPLSPPRDLAIFGLCVVAFAAVGLYPVPSHERPLPEPPDIKHDPVLDEATIAVEKERVEQMRDELEGSDDPETKKLVDKLDKLLEDVEEREISGEEFLDRLEQIEQEHFDQGNVEEFEEAVAEQFEEAAEKLREQADQAGENLGKENQKALEEAAEALENQNTEQASKSLQKLAEKLASNKESLDDETVEKLADMLEKFSDDLEDKQKKLQEMLEQNKQLADKLSEKLDKQGNLSQRNQRRLDRAEENVDKLQNRKDGGGSDDGDGPDRNLERLQRESEEAADKMKGSNQSDNGGQQDGEKRDDSDYQNRSGRQADRSRQQNQRQKQRRQGQQGGEGGSEEKVRQMARKQVEKLRESMRRSRPQRSRNGQSGQSDSQQSGGDRGEKMREYLRRAQGSSESDSQDGSRKRARRQQSGKSQGRGRQQGRKSDGQPGDGQSSGQQQSQKSGNSAGDSPGGEALGDEATSMETDRNDSRVSGDKGEGPSRSQVIRAASEKGFANREYKDVYGDYSPVVEEVMDREDVPPGYRYYVKRYFELIKPRD